MRALRWPGGSGSAGTPAIGESVWLVGYPNVGPFLISSGEYSGPFRKYFTASAPIFAGNSGGPVLDSDGSAVGLAIALDQFRASTQLGDTLLLPIYHVTFFTPISSIATWLGDYGIL